MTPSDEPLDADAVFRLLSGFADRRKIVLAVSGGADSSALMVLAARWRRQGGKTPLLVATVDHGLRPESADECRRVVEAAQSLGLPGRILRWAGPKPATRLQARAREARLALLCEAAREEGADALALAHTLGDQAETVLMRLAHGSGPQGLAAMRPVSMMGGIALLRPLLGTTRDTLLALLRREGRDWIEDPSNGDPRFERVRARRLMAATAPLGLTPQRLARLARRAASAADALDTLTAERFAVLALPTEGAVTLDADFFAAQPEEIRLRCLAHAVRLVGAPAPLRLERLETLHDAVMGALGAGVALRRTLGGAAVLVAKGRIRLAPETPRRRGRRPSDGQY